MRIWKQALFFFVGGLLYVALELCWRGRSHYTMFLLGGLCFVCLNVIGGSRFSFLTQMFLGVTVIVCLELMTGIVVNRMLGLGVWDYSGLPYHFMGQICLNYALLWVPLSAAGLLAASALRRLLGETPPPIRWV